MDKKNRPDDPLDDLMKSLREEETEITSGEKETSFDPEIARSEVNRKHRVENFSLNIEGEEPKHFNREVYFSNPPQTNLRVPQGGSLKQNPQKTIKLEKKTPVPEKTVSGYRAFMQREFKKTWYIETFSSLAVILAIIAICSLIIISYTITGLNDILGIPNNDTIVEVTIDDEDDTNSVIDTLDDYGLITNSSCCKLFAKVIKIKNTGYTPGVYTFTADTGLEKMLTKIKVSATTTETVKLTFPEGWTIDQIGEKLEKYDVCTKTAFYQTINNIDFSAQFPFLKGISEKGNRYKVLEGFIFPDTYEFYINEAPSSVVKKFLTNFDNKWTTKMQTRAEKLGYTPDEVVRIASIIEREAYSSAQMPGIASVLQNRLKNGSAFPTLGCDSTTDFLEAYVKPNCTSQEYVKYIQKYDTHLCSGLPAGAICSPGMSAIEAVLYPDDSDYYYFVHDKNGKIYYAKTGAQHEKNIDKVYRVNNSK